MCDEASGIMFEFGIAGGSSYTVPGFHLGETFLWCSSHAIGTVITEVIFIVFHWCVLGTSKILVFNLFGILLLLVRWLLC